MSVSALSPKKALVSVSDKTNLVPLCQFLHRSGIEIISTGGTAKTLIAADIPVTLVSELTGFPEIMQGRVKTLHPKIHGGILGKRHIHLDDAKLHNIDWIDVVVCNLYPFSKEVNEQTELNYALENIDIGGPSMIRSAAKNFPEVTVMVDPKDYDQFQKSLEKDGTISLEYRQKLATKAFAHTTWYDDLIYRYLNQRSGPDGLYLQYEKSSDLRYGENPHQSAALYQSTENQYASGVAMAHQYQGKPMSYNNIVDADGALNCIVEFEQPCCVVIKHANPCGVAIAEDINVAFERAWQADSQSAFGGIIALNRPCTAKIAEFLSTVFVEIVMAPSYDDQALAILTRKPNLRVLELPLNTHSNSDVTQRFISGGVLVQTRDRQVLSIQDLHCVTEASLCPLQIPTILFSWQVLKHIKSNGILIAQNEATLGVGAGQVSRVDAVKLAIMKAKQSLDNAVLVSDAFFPFADSIDLIAQAGIKTIIQPGGSIKDQEVIEACNQHGIAMAMTGKRCFNH